MAGPEGAHMEEAELLAGLELVVGLHEDLIRVLPFIVPVPELLGQVPELHLRWRGCGVRWQAVGLWQRGALDIWKARR